MTGESLFRKSTHLIGSCRSRKENLERALSHKKEGNTTAALKCYQRAVDVTPLMAKKFIDVCFCT